MSIIRIRELIAEAWPIHGLEEDEACETLIITVLKEVRETQDELLALQQARRTGSCAYDQEGRTICPAVAKTEQMVNAKPGYDPIGGGGGSGRSDLPYGQGGGDE